jgi:uncharacterized protein YneR
MITRSNQTGTTSLFTNDTGMERHFSVRLWAQYTGSPGGAGVSILVNDEDPGISDGFAVNVSTGVPVRQRAEHLLLQPGDEVKAQVQGGAVNLKVGVSVDTDEYA